MSISQTIQAIWPYIGPLTQQVLNEWLSSPLTFVQVIMGYGGIHTNLRSLVQISQRQSRFSPHWRITALNAGWYQRSQVVRELEACRVLRWVNGVPEFVPFL